MGGFLEFGGNELTTETTVSGKLLAANKGWVYRNNDVIAKEVANIEFELFRMNLKGGEIVYDPIIQHPLLDILDQFNEFTSSSDGFYITQSHRKLAGDAFWFVDGQGTNIKGIYLLQPDKVTINLGKIAGNNKVIESYTYKDTIKGEQVEVTYAPEDIIHFKIPNPANYYRGKSTVEAAAEAIDTDSMAIEANMKLFERGLIANFMLSTEKSLTQDQLKQLHTEFRNTYGGVKNAYKVPILSGGIKSENLQMSNRDAQYLEQQEWLRDKITSIFGNNKAVLGITTDVNRANAEATILQWKQTTIRSEMKEITDTLNEFLVPRFGKNLVLGFTDLVQEDETEKIDLAVKKKNADIISINEAREELGLDPIDGGDEHNFQRNERQTANEVPKAIKYIKLNKYLRRGGIFEKQAEQKKTLEEARRVATKMVKARRKNETKPVEQLDKYGRYIKKQLKIADSQYERFLDAVQSFLNKVVDKAIENIPAEVQQMQKKQLLNVDDTVTEAVFDLAPYLQDVAKQAGGEALALINENAPGRIIDPTSQIEANVRKFSKSMVTTAEGKMIDIITAGVKNGNGAQKISQSIRKEMPSFTKTQSDRIARTELLRASNLASQQAWEESGVVSGKEWDARFDADEICKQYDGEIVQINKNFYQEEKFANGNPPIHPNCRCVLLPVLFNDKRVNVWSDQRGYLGGDEQTLWHSYRDAPIEGLSGNDLFGDALYMGINKDQALGATGAQEAFKVKVPLQQKDVLIVANQTQLEKLIKEAIVYANKNKLPLDTKTAIPSYLTSQGYKGAFATPEFDEFGGLAIVDKLLRKQIESKLQDLINKKKVKDDIVKELETERTNNKKLLKKLKEQENYIKDVEGYLDEN